MSYEVIAKGEFPPSRISGFISPAQYLYVKEDKQKYLLLKLANGRDETATGVRLEVSQKDAFGAELGVLTEDCANLSGGPHSMFVFDKKLALSDNCADFMVKIISADFGGYTYTVCGDGLVLSNKKRERAGIAAVAGGGTGRAVSVSRFKVPVAACIFMLLTLALAMIFTYYHLQSLIADTNTFFHEGVEYAFEYNDKSEGSRIYAVGSKKKVKEIVIPEKVKGHEVAGIAERAFNNNGDIEKVTVQAAVGIPDNAFAYCSRLSVLNAEKVPRIGNFAFRECLSLKTLNLPSLNSIGSKAFEGCSSLSSVDITNSGAVLEIGSNAFAWCASLTSVKIDQYIDYSQNASFFSNSNNIQKLHLKNFNYSYEFEGAHFERGADKTISELFGLSFMQASTIWWLNELTIDYCGAVVDNFCTDLPLRTVIINELELPEIGANAFSGCISLTKFVTPAGITRVGQSAFYNSAIREFDGGSLEYIGDNAFSECVGLTAFKLENNDKLSYIGERAFSYCSSLESIFIPQTVKDIKSGTFDDCRNLSVVTGGAIQTIGDYAFRGCSSLVNAPLSEQTVSIGTQAFYECSALQAVTVPQSVRQIGRGAFAYCEEIEEMTLPFIGGSATANKTLAYIFDPMLSPVAQVPRSLKKVTIKSAAEIGANAFNGCSYLKEIIIQSDFARIGDNAFADCKSLRSFVIPASVTQISDNAFSDCYKLHEVYNLSMLNITAGTAANGSAGYYAIQVYDSLGENKMPKVTYADFEFGRSGANKWYLLDYSGEQSALTLPLNVYYNNIRIESYEVVKYAMYDNFTIRSVIITGAVSAIGEYAFGSCSGLASAVVADSVLSIGFAAFENCNSLKTLTVPFVGGSAGGNRYFGYIFGRTNQNSSGNIPYNLRTVNITKATDIPDYGFYGCYYIETINLPNTVEVIGERAFTSCGALKTIELPSAVNTIRSRAFSDCTSLEKVTLSGNAFIDSDAFKDCSKLYEVVNLSSLSITAGSTDNGYIAYYAIAVHTSAQYTPVSEVRTNGRVFKRYGDNWALVDYTGTALTLTLSSFEYQGSTVSKYRIKPNAFSGNSYPVNLIIGREVEGIDENAFYSNNGIKTVRFEDSQITKLSESAFRYCRYLESVELPQGLTEIGARAFERCPLLYSITIPASVKSIGYDAFYGCYALSDVINLSGHLTVSKGTATNGSVALYALRVSTSAAAPLESVLYGDFRFMLSEGQWYLISIVNGGNYMQGSGGFSLPEAFIYNSTTVISYILAESALEQSYYERVNIPRSVSGILIVTSASYSLSIEAIYYKGTAQEWAALVSSLPWSQLRQKTVYYNS